MFITPIYLHHFFAFQSGHVPNHDKYIVFQAPIKVVTQILIYAAQLISRAQQTHKLWIYPKLWVIFFKFTCFLQQHPQTFAVRTVQCKELQALVNAHILFAIIVAFYRRQAMCPFGMIPLDATSGAQQNSTTCQVLNDCQRINLYRIFVQCVPSWSGTSNVC